MPSQLKYRYRRVATSSFREDIARRCGLQLGLDGRGNAYGTLVAEEYHQEDPSVVVRTLPVICGHGGSGWLCSGCADRMAAEMVESPPGSCQP